MTFLIKRIRNKSRKFNKKNKTPLHYAVENDSIEMLKFLLFKGADIKAKDIHSLKIIILFFLMII